MLEISRSTCSWSVHLRIPQRTVIPAKGPLADAADILQVFQHTHDQHSGRRRIDLRLKSSVLSKNRNSFMRVADKVYCLLVGHVMTGSPFSLAGCGCLHQQPITMGSADSELKFPPNGADYRREQQYRPYADPGVAWPCVWRCIAA